MGKYIDFVAIILYSMLGGVLSACGIPVAERPGEFFMIMGLVVLIDVNSARLIFKAQS